MKVHEILKEAGLPDGTLKQYSDYEQSDDSPENLDYALNDAAMQAFMQIEQDPMGYYKAHGEDASQYARQISSILASVDDNTLELMGESPMVKRAIEDNYDPEGDDAYIPLETLMQVIAKVRDRRTPQNPQSEERIGHDAGRPGHDDLAAYDR